MKLVCKTKCFINAQLFAPGETLELKDEVYAAEQKKGKNSKYKYFVQAKDYKPEVKAAEKDPKTFHEAQKKGKDSEELFK